MFNITLLRDYLATPRALKVILAILGIILLISIVNIIQLGLKPTTMAQTEAVSPVSVKAFTPSPLFGESPNEGVLKQTRLQLTLKGTFAASESTQGSAVISTATGEHIYVVGDQIEGAMIKDIQPDYVVLEYQGNNEILRLPEGQRLTTP